MHFSLRATALTVLFQVAIFQSFGQNAQIAIQTVLTPSLTYMQVVAHQDDDFLFMNPDVANQIVAGVNTVTIYLTAGQSCGTTTARSCNDPVLPPDLSREEFAAARQNGIRAAYAQMAQVADVWTRTLVQPDLVHTVELYTLNASPNIELLFMNLPDGGDPLVPHADALSNMYQDPTYVTDTVVPVCDAYTLTIIPNCDPQTNQPAVPLQYYNHAGVLAVLSALVKQYQPIEVRTLDPQPFEKLTPDGQNYEVSYDNLDHTATARFLDQVLANYHGPNGTGRYTVNYYKGYSSPDYPANLGQADYDQKLATATTYTPYDPNFTYYQANYDTYYRHIWERYPGSTTWLQRSSDGRLVAVSVENRRVKYWYENTAGGAWIGPVSICCVNPIAPYLTLLRRPDGRLQIFALRLPLKREQWFPAASVPLQDVVTTIQVPTTTSAISFSSWQSLGSPDAGNCSGGCQFVGVPTATIDGSGRAFVFAKNSQGLVSYTFSTGSGWSAWDATSFSSQIQAYAGAVSQDILDGIAAVTRDDGVIEVFATMRVGFDGSAGALWHFVQNPNSTTFTFDPSLSDNSVFAYERAASAPTVTKNQNGTIEIFYREAADATLGNPGARVLTLYQGNGLVYGPTILYGDAGAGPVAAIRRESTGEIMLFERNFWEGSAKSNETRPTQTLLLFSGKFWEA
jgi:hypothetical protein